MKFLEYGVCGSRQIRYLCLKMEELFLALHNLVANMQGEYSYIAARRHRKNLSLILNDTLPLIHKCLLAIVWQYLVQKDLVEDKLERNCVRYMDGSMLILIK